MRRNNNMLAVVGLAVLVAVVADPGYAQVLAPTPTTVIQGGNTFYDLVIAYAGILGTVVAALASWALFKFTGIKIEANYRSALETFVNNAAGAFLVRFETLKQAGNIDVHNEVIAGLANGALSRIPQTLDHFNLKPDDLKQRIIEKIGIMTAVSPVTPAAVVVPSIPRV